jgi:hypothetical protein
VIIFLLGLAFSALGGFLVAVVWVVGSGLVFWLYDRYSKTAADKLMQPACTGRVFAGFVRVTERFYSSKGFDVFTFTNSTYADKFSRSNGGVLVKK